MRALWSRWGSSLFTNVNESPEEDIAYIIRGKMAIKRQTFLHVDGNGEPVARITRFWFDDETTDDLIFFFRWQGIDNVLAEW